MFLSNSALIKRSKKKNLKLISFVPHVIVNIRAGKVMPILLRCIPNWLILSHFTLLKGTYMKINLLYNFSNRVFDVNLRKRIAASCYYLLPVETKLIIKYWILKKKLERPFEDSA